MHTLSYLCCFLIYLCQPQFLECSLRFPVLQRPVKDHSRQKNQTQKKKTGQSNRPIEPYIWVQYIHIGLHTQIENASIRITRTIVLYHNNTLFVRNIFETDGVHETLFTTVGKINASHLKTRQLCIVN